MDLRAQLKATLDRIGVLQAIGEDKLTDDQLAELEKLTAEANETRTKIAAGDRRRSAIAAAAGLVAAVATAGAGRLIAPPGGLPRAGLDPVTAHLAIEKDPRRGWGNAGEFALSVASLFTPGRQGEAMQDERLRMMAAVSGASVGVPSDGGVLMPPAFSTQIWEGMHAVPDSLFQLCDQVLIDPSMQKLTMVALDEKSRATGSRFGAVRGYWRKEADQMVGSKVKLREVTFEPRQLYVFFFATNELLRGAGSTLEGMMVRGASEEINFLLNDAILHGTGVGMPLGIIGHPATIVQLKVGGQAADTVLSANVNGMWSKCHARWRANAIWLANQEVETELETLQIAVGTGGLPIFLPPGGITEQPNSRLKGRQIKFTEWNDKLGDVGDLMLVNLKAYALALRGSVDAAMSIHLRFDFNETAFRFIFEADGQPWPNKPLTPFKGASDLSPFVVLEAR